MPSTDDGPVTPDPPHPPETPDTEELDLEVPAEPRGGDRKTPDNADTGAGEPPD